jgi:D-alanyl-D-alanine carboxypeptidase
MKKWVFWLVVFAIIGYGLTRDKTKVDQEKPAEENTHVQADIPEKDGLSIPVTKDRIYKGDLLLVNKAHPVPPGGDASEEINLSKHRELENGFVILDKTIRLTPSLLKKFSTLIEAARKDGVNRFMISSGYRDEQEQSKLYKEMGSDYALPAGYSEHNLGLSLDIGSTQGEMEHAAEGKWLRDNAWKYGFILRYPEDKTDITGIRNEPWHFRYVGLPHSAIMHQNNFVLEEYLDFLKEQKSMKATVDNQVYKIFYYPISKNTTIHVPAKGLYEMSGNNTDGVIVTVSSVTSGQRGAVPREGNG